MRFCEVRDETDNTKAKAPEVLARCTLSYLVYTLHSLYLVLICEHSTSKIFEYNCPIFTYSNDEQCKQGILINSFLREK